MLIARIPYSKFMKVLEGIASFAQREGLEFLVIGGHAMNAHGYARPTGDLDLLVPDSKRDIWIGQMDKVGSASPHRQPFAPSCKYRGYSRTSIPEPRAGPIEDHQARKVSRATGAVPMASANAAIS